MSNLFTWCVTLKKNRNILIIALNMTKIHWMQKSKEQQVISFRSAKHSKSWYIKIKLFRNLWNQLLASSRTNRTFLIWCCPRTQPKTFKCKNNLEYKLVIKARWILKLFDYFGTKKNSSKMIAISVRLDFFSDGEEMGKIEKGWKFCLV